MGNERNRNRISDSRRSRTPAAGEDRRGRSARGSGGAQIRQSSRETTGGGKSGGMAAARRTDSAARTGTRRTGAAGGAGNHPNAADRRAVRRPAVKHVRSHMNADSPHRNPVSRRPAGQTAKIIPYKKPLNINLGMIIFGIIFVYVAICVFMFFTSKHIIGYEVVSGSLSVPNVYKGIALRKEQLVDATQAGYVNYFAREGEHVAKGDLVYTIDQSGRIAELINSESESIQLSDRDLEQLKSDILIFQHNYDDTSFGDVYDFHFDIKGTALKLSNYNMLSNVDSISGSGTGMVSFCSAPESGVVVYSVDGYENLTPETISENSLDVKEYEKQQLVSNELVSMGDTVYKLITDENWSILIEVTEERAASLESEEYVEVRFLKNQYTAWAKADIMRKEDNIYALLTFNNSMITFATDRFIDIEIISNAEEGLKIPNSSIVEKEFYLIPKEYAQLGQKGEMNGFLRETYDEEGNISSELIETTVYSESETDYYVDTSQLRIGDYIIMPDSQNKYPVSKVGTLIGVYNMDKGYADFKEITILYSNEEYSIVKSNTQYGLSVYDHIVLDASSVEENDFLH